MVTQAATANPAVRPNKAGDALPALVGYVLVLVGIPSALIVKPLGAAGTPAQIVAIAIFGWWVASRVISGRPPERTNPIKWLLLLFAVACVSAYVAGMTRPITYSVEVNSADRALLSLCAWAGIVLVMIDGISTRKRLDTLLKVVAGGVGVIAALGIIQFVFKLDLTHIIRFPGLTQNKDFGQLVARSAYNRVTGTTTHPIEFGVVLSAGLPLLFHFARFSETAKHRRWWWTAVCLVGIALPMSVARSGALGGLIAVVYLFYTWPGRLRLKVAVIGIVGALVMSVAVPGLLGTIRGLFLNASSDPSTQGRTADYAPAFSYVKEHPLFGRGVGTFIPSIYRTLDNAYLGLLVEAGILGMIAFLVLLIGAGFVAGSVRRRSKSESTRDLAQCLKAAIAVLAVNAATFDALGFAMCAGMIFVYIGGIGSLWSLESRGRPRPPRRLSDREWKRAFIAGGVALLAILAVGGLGVQAAKPDYLDYGALIANPPGQKDLAPFTNTSSTSATVSVLRDIMRGHAMREKMAAAGVPLYEVALRNGSIVSGTDLEGDSGPVLYVETTAPTPQIASAAIGIVFREAINQVSSAQAQVGVPASGRIEMSILQQTPPFPAYGRSSRSHIGFVIVFGIVAGTYYQFLRRRRMPRINGEAALVPSDNQLVSAT